MPIAIALFSAAAIAALVCGWRRLALALALWPVLGASVVARDLLFGGQIHVWPFLLAACALASLSAPVTGALLGLSVVAAQAVEWAGFSDPLVLQFAVLPVIGFIGLAARDFATVGACVILSLLSVSAGTLIQWRMAMILGEVTLVSALCAGIANAGFSGGISQGIRRRTSAVPRAGRMAPASVGAARSQIDEGQDVSGDFGGASGNRSSLGGVNE